MPKLMRSNNTHVRFKMGRGLIMVESCYYSGRKVTIPTSHKRRANKRVISGVQRGKFMGIGGHFWISRLNSDHQCEMAMPAVPRDYTN